MDQKIVIGKKLTRKDVLKSFLVIQLYVLIILFVLIITVIPVLKMTVQMQVISIVIVVLLTFIFTIPAIGATQRLEITKENICYYHIEGMKNQFKEVIRILIQKEEKANFKIPLESIKNVSLSYVATAGGYGVKGYVICFSFLLKDYSMIKFSPFNIAGGGNHYQEYAAMLDYLQKRNIEIIDHYHLKDQLKNQEILNYINEIEANK